MIDFHRAQELLGQEEALLNYVVTSEGIIILAATAAGRHFQHLSYPIEDLRQDIKRVGQCMRSLQHQVVEEDLWFRYCAVGQAQPVVQETLENLQRELAKLFALLVAPVLAVVGRKSHWVVVPHGPLHQIPWAALRYGDRYLVEKHSISLLPSASLGAVLELKSPPSTGTPVFFADPDPTHPSLQLPATQQEVETGHQVLPGGPEPFVGTAATKSEFLRSAPDARLLHLACHHFFDASAPLLLFLKLAGDRGEEFLYAFEIADLELNAQLVTLSACESGLSVVSTGDEQMGIVRSFLAAGALSVISTLWSIEDQSAAAFFRDFYPRAKSVGLPEALVTVQRRFLADPELSLPYFWAPYVLTGRWDNPLSF